MEEMGDFKKSGQNVYYSPYTFQIVDVRSLLYLKLKEKINFDSKFYFLYFLALGLKR
jgi:hypothetical protein